MSIETNNSSESQPDSVRLTDPNTDTEKVHMLDQTESMTDKENKINKPINNGKKKADRITFIALVFIAIMIIVTIYQQIQITSLTNAVSMNIVELNSLNKLNKKGDHKIAVLPLRATIKAWSAADPSGIMAMKAIDKTINVYQDAGYLILDGDSLVGGPAWAKLISITPQDLDGEE